MHKWIALFSLCALPLGWYAFGQDESRTTGTRNTEAATQSVRAVRNGDDTVTIYRQDEGAPREARVAVPALPTFPVPPQPPGRNSYISRSYATVDVNGEVSVVSYANGGMPIELVNAVNEIIGKLARARGAEREKLKEQLVPLLEKQFSLKQKHHEEEINRLAEQLAELKAMVNKRQEHRREIIARRLEQITKDADGLGW